MTPSQDEIRAIIERAERSRKEVHQLCNVVVRAMTPEGKLPSFYPDRLTLGEEGMLTLHGVLAEYDSEVAWTVRVPLDVVSAGPGAIRSYFEALRSRTAL